MSHSIHAQANPHSIQHTPVHQANNSSPASHADATKATQQTSASPPTFKYFSNPMLAQSLLKNFNDFESISESNRLTLKSLEKVAAGKLPNGLDATPEQIELAKEVLSRPELIRSLDKDLEGKEDGDLHWNDIAILAEDFKSISDYYLVAQTKVYFHELAATPDDTYVSINDLKEAAGERPTTRTFSPQAKAVARELLQRPALLKELDIGVNWWGAPGKKDGRFDLANIKHVLSRADNQPAREYPVGKIGGGRP